MASGNYTVNITLSKTFANTSYSVAVVPYDSGMTPNLSNKYTGGFSLGRTPNTANNNFDWIAIGRWK